MRVWSSGICFAFCAFVFVSIAQEFIRGGRSADENRQLNAQLMDTSKLFAIAVAMRQLGHEVTLVTSGTA